MTTGRINQVATSRSATRSAGSGANQKLDVRNVCVEFRLRPCISFAIVLYHGSAPASAPPWRGAARKAGSAASALARFILCSEHRRAALSDAFDWFLNGWLKKATIDPYNSKIRAQVIQSRTSWHSMIKAKKKSEPGGSLIKHLLDVTRKRKTRNQRGCYKAERKENKISKNLKPTLISKN